MNTVANPYDALYTNLKTKYTVVHNGVECTVGDFMLMKAGKSSAVHTTLPAETVKTIDRQPVIANLMNYVNDKLAVKNPPQKDVTLKRFPLKASLSAMLSAVAACALIISCGIFAIRGASDALITPPDEYSHDLAQENETPKSNSETNLVFE